MAAKKATRRKVIQRANLVSIPADAGRTEAIGRMSTPELKNLLRAAGLPIPKTKPDMVARLPACDAVAVAVTTEVVVFGPPTAK